MRPVKVPGGSARLKSPDETAVKLSFARLITHADHGSLITMGVQIMRPGDESLEWSFRAEDVPEGDSDYGLGIARAPGEMLARYGPRHETYYVVKGHIQLDWDEGVIDAGPDDAIFLPPGWTYRVRTVGNETAMIVYSIYPATA